MECSPIFGSCNKLASRLDFHGIQLVTVPLLHGLWAMGLRLLMLPSLMNWFVLADFGMGCASNLVTKARIKGNDIRGVMAAAFGRP